MAPDTSLAAALGESTVGEGEARRLRTEVDAARQAKTAAELALAEERDAHARTRAELMMVSTVAAAEAEAVQRKEGLLAERSKLSFQEFLNNSPHLTVLQQRLAELESQNTALKNDLLDAEHRYEFVNTARDLLKAELADLQSKLLSVTARGPEHVAEFEYIQAQLGKLREESVAERRSDAIRIANLEADLERTRKELDKAMGTNQVGRLEAELNDVRFEKSLALETKTLLEQQLSIANGDREALREDLEYARSSMQVLKDAVARTEAAMKAERAEHAQAQKLVEEDLVELERYRREWRDMQDTIAVEREVLKKEVQEVNALLATHLSGRDSESTATQKLIQDVERSKERAASLSMDLEKARAENNRLRVELLELRESMAKRVREADAEKERVMRRTVEIAQSADRAVQENEQLVLQVSTLRNTASEVTAERDEIATECLRNRQELEALRKELVDLKEERRRDHNDFATYAAKMREHRDALARSKTHNQELVEELLEARNQYQELKARYATLEEDSKRDLAAEHQRLSNALEYERAQRAREAEVAEAKITRLTEQVDTDWQRAQTDLRRLQEMLDRTREELAMDKGKLPPLLQERERLRFEVEKVTRQLGPLEAQVRTLQDELTRARQDAVLESTRMAARLDQYEIRAAEREQIETRNADLFKEVQQLRYDNTRLVQEVRRWKDKRVGQLVNTAWSENLFDDQDKTPEQEGWMDKAAMDAKRLHEQQVVGRSQLQQHQHQHQHPQILPGHPHQHPPQPMPLHFQQQQQQQPGMPLQPINPFAAPPTRY